MSSASTSEISRLRSQHLGPSCKLFFGDEPLHIVGARGQYMFDDKGRQYLDCINNVCHVGHCHPKVVNAAYNQMTILNTNNRYLHENIAILAKKLADTMPEPLSVCYFVNSGSEANDLAYQLAKTYTGGTELIVLDHAYHGCISSVMDMSPYKFRHYKNPITPPHIHVAEVPDVYRGKYQEDTEGKTDDLGALYGDDVGQIVKDIRSSSPGNNRIIGYIAESLMSCAGQIIPPDNYLRTVYKHIRSAGGVCIADEVQVGFGRVGSTWWAFQLQGPDVVPDIVTVGKPMGNGHPVAAVVTTPEIAKAFDGRGVSFFCTYGGNPVSCAVALSVLSVIEDEGLMKHAAEVGRYTLQLLQTLKSQHHIIGDIRGVGMFIGIEFVKDRKNKTPACDEAVKIKMKCKEKGIIISTDGPDDNIIKFKPPMCFSFLDSDLLVYTIDQALHEMANDQRNGYIGSHGLCVSPPREDKSFHPLPPSLPLPPSPGAMSQERGTLRAAASSIIPSSSSLSNAGYFALGLSLPLLFSYFVKKMNSYLFTN